MKNKHDNPKKKETHAYLLNEKTRERESRSPHALSDFSILLIFQTEKTPLNVLQTILRHQNND